MRIFLLITLLSSFLVSCERVFLGEDEVNSPENNFELFWNDFDQHYGLFTARGWDWDSIYAVYRPQVTPQTTDEELWTIFKEMITYLDDSHTFIARSSGGFFASGSELDSIVETEFSINVVQNQYLQTSTVEQFVPTLFLHGKIKDKNIGYIYVDGIEERLDDTMDEALEDIGGYDAIIFDLRNNYGGDDIVGQDWAGRFTDERRLVYTVQERNGPEHTDFAEPKYYYTEQRGEQSFRKPVILLTDRITVSAAETFMLYMKSIPDVTQIGDTTAGDFSDTGMNRFLPNGWEYQYSIMMFLLPDGSSLDGVGHIPEVQVRNTTADIQAGTDRVLETAIQYLFDTYGID